MFSKLLGNVFGKKHCRSGGLENRRLGFERFEDRRMLASMADILIVADESGSEQNTHTQDWLATIIDDLAVTLAAANIDARYGLIGFGEVDDNGTPSNFSDDVTRFAHTQLVGSTGSKGLWTTSSSDLISAINGNLAEFGAGPSEDGWDGIEHVVAEYDFRANAVPIVVLAQGDQGRRVLNETLTHEGIVQALHSKDAILNTIVAGSLLSNGEPITGEILEPITQTNLSWSPIFKLDAYGLDSDLYILGVESDRADGAADHKHVYHAFDTVTNAVPGSLPTTESDALQISYNGSNTGATGMVASGKSILIGTGLMGGIGPTTAGYRAVSVPFEAVDMTGAATHTLGSAISFSFPFYGSVKSQLWVREDGTISFSDGSPSTPADPGAENADLSRPPAGSDPPRPSDPMIAALWDELAPSASPATGQVLQKIGNFDGGGQNNDLAIQWTDYVYGADTGVQDPITFQAILYGDGRIRFNYLDIDSYPDNQSAAAEPTSDVTGGISATVGIWSGASDSITLPAAKFVPGPHSIQTDISGETSDSYIRMAWDTGGAAWDVGLVDRFGSSSPEANALRDAFIASVRDQILRAHDEGKVYCDRDVVIAINYGGDALPGEGFDADTGDSSSTRHTTTTAINTASNSIPLVDSPPVKAHDVFQSARTGNKTDSVEDDIHLTFPALPHGAYVVELFFAEIDLNVNGSGYRVFDVLLEGRTVLNDYDVFDDRARIVSLSSTENDVAQLGGLYSSGGPAGIVKRFQVDVTSADGAAGLQIDLLSEMGDPILNGIRILRGDGPRVTNVTIANTDDVHTHSFKEVIDAMPGSGIQLLTIPVNGATQIKVKFNEPVIAGINDLKLHVLSRTDTAPTPSTYAFDSATYEATWTFSAGLPAATQYAMVLSDSITDLAGTPLDGEWYNPESITTANSAVSEFPSGDGTPGGDFHFVFTSIMASVWQVDEDNVVNNDELTALLNNWGESVTPFLDGDFNGNGTVENGDLTLMLNTWGVDLDDLLFLRDMNNDNKIDATDVANATDLNGDTVVDSADIDIIMQQWGLDLSPWLVS